MAQTQGPIALGDLSKAHKLEVDLDKTREFRRGKAPQAGVTGNMDLTGVFLLGMGLAQPGWNVVVIPIGFFVGSELPFIATASVTEMDPAGGIPHSGAALFQTSSVQLDQAGQFVQIAFYLSWEWPLPWCLMMILGSLPNPFM